MSIEKYYTQMLPLYKAVQTSLINELEAPELQHYSGANIYRVSSRIKSLESIKAKLHRKGLPLETTSLQNIEDIVGARIVCMFQEDLERIHEYIASCETLQLCATPKAYIWEGMQWAENAGLRAERKASGYGAIHYVARLSPKAVGSANPACSIKFELQVRTLMQEAWAALEHSVGYKNNIPDRIRGYFDSAADLLGLIDRAFQRLKNESNRLQRELDQHYSNEPINFYTLKTLASDVFGVTLTGKPFSNLLKELIEGRTLTVATARRSLESNTYRQAVEQACLDCLLRAAAAEDYLRWMPLYDERLSQQELTSLIAKRLAGTEEYRRVHAKQLLLQTLEQLEPDLAIALNQASKVIAIDREVTIKMADRQALEQLSLNRERLLYSCRQCFGPITQVHLLGP
ncbi:MAG: hypothetical protein RMM17_00740 [Acidobacteriota bacterium]|nr:hypothetical protein [Blastocatellia bacterium]MDW8411194.1 hypothetical protein [Acidobacteriota bacterium]